MIKEEQYSTITVLFKESDTVIDEINKYLDFEDGWDYGSGKKPCELTVSYAKKVYEIGKYYGFEAEPHLLTEGGVSVILFIEDHFLDIDINNDLSLSLRYEIGVGKCYKKVWTERGVKFNLKYIESKLIDIKSKCNNLLETSILKNIPMQKSDLEIIRLSKSIKAEFPFFLNNVQSSNSHIYASI